MFSKSKLTLCIAAIAMTTVLTAAPVQASRISLDRAKIRYDSIAVSTPSPSPEVTRAAGRAAGVDRAKIRVDSAVFTSAPTPVVTQVPARAGVDRAKIRVDSIDFNPASAPSLVARDTPGVVHAPIVSEAPAPVRGGLDHAKIRIDSIDIPSSSPAVTEAPVVSRAPTRGGLDRAKIRYDSIAVTSSPSPVVTRAAGRATGVDRAKIRVDSAVFTSAPAPIDADTPVVTQAPAHARGGLDRAKIMESR